MLANVVAELEASDTNGTVARVRAIELEIRRLEAELAVAVNALDRADVHRVDGHASLRARSPTGFAPPASSTICLT
jgi:hypothetical protein